jgi:DNA modification methylase
LEITYRPIDEIKPDPRNPRKHGREQIQAIARSMNTFGVNLPLLIDRNDQLIAGHGRLEAAKLLGLQEVPTTRLEHLSKAKAKAFMLADNRLAERASWDEEKLAQLLKELSEVALDFDIEDTGFEAAEIDLHIQYLDPAEVADDADEFNGASGPAISSPGDLWKLGENRLYCGSALEPKAYDALLQGNKAAAVFTDPPYNVRIDGHVSGGGKTKHREFAMASGEMTQAQFAEFLATAFKLMAASTVPGALVYSCMDWRHMNELLLAVSEVHFKQVNLAVWVKTNAGMGSLYRSKHELIFVFRNGDTAHTNNVQLGRFGRNRTNVWNYAGANSFPRRGQRKSIDLHPTVKPIALVADAILDCTRRDDIVLDPFIGSGTTILAAERMGRRAYGIELDPLYVDTAIERWQRISGREARHANGETFSALKEARTATP